MRVRLGDTVQVISGNDAGKRGKVLRVNRAAGKAVVEGVNTVHKHVRPSQRNPKGGRLAKEMPVRLSNVLLVCGSCGKATRIGIRCPGDGSKVRFCKKCGTAISQIASAKA